VAGAGVGIAGVDQQRARLCALRQMLAAEGNGCRAEAVLGEYTRCVTARRELDQQDVIARPALDARRGGAERNAAHRKQLLWRRRSVVDRHRFGDRRSTSREFYRRVMIDETAATRNDGEAPVRRRPNKSRSLREAPRAFGI